MSKSSIILALFCGLLSLYTVLAGSNAEGMGANSYIIAIAIAIAIVIVAAVSHFCAFAMVALLLFFS